MNQSPILEIADHFADAATPASFPLALLRYRNIHWSKRVGFAAMSDSDWAKRFTDFDPLPGNLPSPLALRYHGHQFHVYNPDLGDGRGFLYAQLQDDQDRWLDLGTKGSGQTRWSRQGDGRLTLKGGVREVLASTYLEALGANTSKTFSLVETGEPLQRNDEPSPTRSAVMVRLSHSHLRFGTFQRAAYHDDIEAMTALIRHVISHYYPECADEDLPTATAALFSRMCEATAKMIGQWMAIGFIHGVMNTDNFNITGETFDFGPWRFQEQSDPNRTAAYFDQQGLYRFGRQPTQGLWALQQLGGALTLVCEPDPLTESLKAYTPAYQKAFAGHTFALLGLQPSAAPEEDLPWLQTFYGWMTESQADWPQTFFDWYGGALSEDRAAKSPQAPLYAEAEFAPVKAGLVERAVAPNLNLEHAYFARSRPVALPYDTVEAIWAKIAEEDNWSAFEAILAEMEHAREAYGLSEAALTQWRA